VLTSTGFGKPGSSVAAHLGGFGWWRRLVVAVAAFLCASALASSAYADRVFTPARFTTNDTGNITMIANTLETCPVDPPGQTACSSAQAGATGSTLNNNDWVMRRVDQDGDPATTLDSSSANLSLPAGATVLFAGLYFGAVTTAGASGAAACADPPNTAQPSPTLPACSPAGGTDIRKLVKLKVPGASSYTSLTASVLDISSSSADGRYQGFVDVTSQVTAAGSGTYWVGDVREATGKDRYGGWALVVAYHDATQPLRNLTVFDGLQSVTQGTTGVSIPLSGFLTPPAGQVQTTLGVVAYEGDRGLTGDSLALNTTKLSDASNPVNNFFNSAISSGGVDVTTKSPSYVNQLGFDAILVNANGVLANNATSAAVNLQTSSDQYFPGVVTFATNLYAPSVQATKSVANVTHPGGPNARGDTLRYTVTFTNSGQDGARDFLATDVIPAGTTYVPGSLRLLTGPNSPAAPTDATGDDVAEFDPVSNKVVFRLGQGANAARGGLLTAAGASGNTTSFSFDVTIDGADPVGTQITNQAGAQFLSQTLATPLTATTPPVVTTVDAPDLTLTKSHSPQFVAGGTTTFTLAVSNVGTLATDGTPVTVTDNVPGGAAGFDSIALVSAPGWACAIALGTTSLSCSRSDPLAPGASYPQIALSAVVHSPVSPTIQNTAAVAGGGDSDPTDNTATDVGAGVSVADLDVTKTVDQSVVPSGGRVTFDLEVHNSGPSTATSATLDDPLGASYANVSVIPTVGTCTSAVHCDLGDLAPNATVDVAITATVTAHDTTLTNTATVASTTTDPVSSDNSATVSFRVPLTADLTLTKTIAANPAAPFPTAGVTDGATYTLGVTNSGPDTAANVRVDDPLPPSFTPSTVSAPGFSCAIQAAAGGVFAVVCTRPTLAVADGTLTIAITGTFADSAAGTIVPNGARADSDALDPDPASATDTIDTLLIPAADLQLAKSDGGFVAPGGTATFTLTLFNAGPSPANATAITDALPAGLTFVSASAGCAAAGGVVTCPVGTLAAGATATATVTVQAASSAAGQTLTNLASATSTTPDPDSSNDQATASIVVTNPTADLDVTKTASVGSLDPGGAVAFSIAVENNGPDPAQAVVVTDELPPGLAFASASPGCTAAGSLVTCALGDLPDETTVTVTVAATATDAAAGQTLTNTASATSSTPDPSSADNQGTAAVTVNEQAPAPPASPPAPTPPPAPPAAPPPAAPDLVAAKTASKARVPVGDEVTFTLKVSDDGSGDATGVKIEDALPPGLEIATLPAGCAAAARTITCTAGTLAAASTRSFAIVVRPTAAAAGTTITNAETVTGDEPDPTPSDDAAMATIEVEAENDLSVTAAVTPEPPVAGHDATYTATIENRGPDAATDVVLSDELPDGVTVVSAETSHGRCTTPGTEIRCELGSLPSGSTARVTFVVRLARTLGGRRLSDSIDVTDAVADPNAKNNLATLTTRVAPAAPLVDLAVGIGVRERQVQAGGLLHYTVTAANLSGVPATGVRLTASLNEPVRLASVLVGPARVPTGADLSTGSCVRALPLVCSLGRLGPHEHVTIDFVVTPLRALRLLGTVSIRADQAEITVRNNHAKVAILVAAAQASVVVRKTAQEGRVTAGTSAHYVIRVQAAGDVAALDLRVCDRLPDDQVYAGVDGAAYENGDACWTIARLAPGDVRSFAVSTTVDRSSTTHTSTNTVHVTGANIAPSIAQASIEVLGVPGRAGGATG
jgi:uncharacterized repeat protein (TIGR01451 family)